MMHIGQLGQLMIHNFPKRELLEKTPALTNKIGDAVEEVVPLGRFSEM